MRPLTPALSPRGRGRTVWRFFAKGELIGLRSGTGGIGLDE